MTARALVLLAALLGAGCATTNGGGERTAASPVREQARRGGAVAPLAVSPAAAPADSSTLTFTLPRYGSQSGCDPDTTRPLHDRLDWRVLSLNLVTPPMYTRACEADSACWAQVRAFNVPKIVASGVGAPGERCSTRLGVGEYFATSGNGAGWARCWGNVVRVGQ